jgi:outer membrane protein OmpA-like peptidoglycan-associated protein
MTSISVTKSTFQALSLGAFICLSACSAALPPKELVDARAAYAQAQEGPAGELAPAKLDGAHQALQEAEVAFEEDPESEKTKTLAYIAELQARASAATGEREKNKRKVAELDRQYSEFQRKRLNMTKEELEATRARLEQEKQRASAGEAALAAKDKDLAAKEKTLAQKDLELAAEREARKAAESKLSAAIASLAEMGSIKEEARGVVITLSGSVLFATGKSELLPIAKDKLNEVAAALKDQGFKAIVIEGHTDSRGSASGNDKLSLDRATSVKVHLVSQGLDGSKIEAKGLGSSRAIATNDTPDGRANNRRVELVVTPK